jgi:predicted nucleic acid-binding protein
MQFASFLALTNHSKTIAPKGWRVLTKPQIGSNRALAKRSRRLRPLRIVAGRERTSTIVAALVDTNILVYRFDSRFPAKQKIATDLLRKGIEHDDLRVPHQAIVEFVAAVTRAPNNRQPILRRTDAFREAEEFLSQFKIVYPNETILRNAMRGCVAYQLSWFEAQIWAYAEFYSLSEILTEDFEHDRLYGSVRVVNPFLPAHKTR